MLINIAIISLLPENGKDLTQRSSYRPLLARRLDNYLNKLVHYDQTGFVRNRFSLDNLRWLFRILHNSVNSESSWMVLSVDAEKVFDRIEWCYLWSVLEPFGFDTKFITMVKKKTFYESLSAVISTSNTCSQLFKIARGTCYGCPLSPIIICVFYGAFSPGSSRI